MTTLCKELIGTSDYLLTAIDLHVVIAGEKAKPFHPANWHAKVRGRDPETGDEIGVAWYDVVYETKAEASTKARELFKVVKEMRKI